MGTFWDLWQESDLMYQNQRSNSIEDRLDYLEEKLDRTTNLLEKLMSALEEATDEDIDGDGTIG